MSNHPVFDHPVFGRPVSTCCATSHAEAGGPLTICLAALTLTLLLAAPAYPQSPAPSDSSDAMALLGAEHQEKDPKRAVLYSVWGTVLGTPVFGPAAGHFYAENHGQAWVGIGTRVGGTLLPFLGLATAGRSGSGGLGIFFTTVLTGGAVVLLSALHDITTADLCQLSGQDPRGLHQPHRIRRAGSNG